MRGVGDTGLQTGRIARVSCKRIFSKRIRDLGRAAAGGWRALSQSEGQGPAGPGSQRHVARRERRFSRPGGHPWLLDKEGNINVPLFQHTSVLPYKSYLGGGGSVVMGRPFLLQTTPIFARDEALRSPKSWTQLRVGMGV